jgi:hypothetical protein
VLWGVYWIELRQSGLGKLARVSAEVPRRSAVVFWTALTYPPSPLVLLKIFELKTLVSDLDVWEAGLNATIRRVAGSRFDFFCWVNYSLRVKGSAEIDGEQ